MQGRYGAMAEFEPTPGDVSAYRQDLKPIYDQYRARLQGAFGSDLSGKNIRKHTSTLLDIPPEEKALLSAEEKALVNRAEKVYMKKYYESKEAGYNHSAADELAREEVDAVMGQHALDEDFSFASPEKIFSEREQIQQIRDPKLRAAEELEELGSRITEPVDLRPSRQYSLNDLVPDPNIRKVIRERLTPEDLDKVIKEFTKLSKVRHPADVPIPTSRQGAVPIKDFATTGYRDKSLQSSFIDFLIGDQTYSYKKGGRVKAKKKAKFIPKIIKNRSIRGKKKTSKPLGVGAAQRGWGAVRSA